MKSKVKVRVRNLRTGTIKEMLLHVALSKYAIKGGWIIEDKNYNKNGTLKESTKQDAPKKEIKGTAKKTASAVEGDIEINESLTDDSLDDQEAAGATEDLSDLPMKELRALAKDRDVKVPFNVTKVDLIELLNK